MIYEKIRPKQYKFNSQSNFLKPYSIFEKKLVYTQNLIDIMKINLFECFKGFIIV